MSDSKAKSPRKGRSASAATKEESEPRAAKVVRDPHFIRTLADTSSVVFIGRYMEISLLVNSPALMGVTLNEESGSLSDIEFDPTVVETALVRMNPSAARYLSLNIQFALLQTGELSYEELQRHVTNMKTILPKKEA